MDLVLDRAHIAILDQLLAAPHLRRQAPFTDPATDRVFGPTDPRSGLSHGEHELRW